MSVEEAEHPEGDAGAAADLDAVDGEPAGGYVGDLRELSGPACNFDPKLSGPACNHDAKTRVRYWLGKEGYKRKNRIVSLQSCFFLFSRNPSKEIVGPNPNLTINP